MQRDSFRRNRSVNTVKQFAPSNAVARKTINETIPFADEESPLPFGVSPVKRGDFLQIYYVRSKRRQSATRDVVSLNYKHVSRSGLRLEVNRVLLDFPRKTCMVGIIEVKSHDVSIWYIPVSDNVKHVTTLNSLFFKYKIGV